MIISFLELFYSAWCTFMIQLMCGNSIPGSAESMIVFKRRSVLNLLFIGAHNKTNFLKTVKPLMKFCYYFEMIVIKDTLLFIFSFFESMLQVKPVIT